MPDACFSTQQVMVELTVHIELLLWYRAVVQPASYVSDLEKILLYAILALGSVVGFAYLEARR
jgi:hypothetical protein